MTECLVTACGPSDPTRRNRLSCNGTFHDIDAVFTQSSLPRQLLQRLNASGLESTMVLIVGAVERATFGAILLGFGEQQFSASAESFSRLSIVVSDGLGDDAVQFECDRYSDLESILMENNSTRLVSVTANRITPTTDSFVFSECKLTILQCALDQCDELPKIVDSVSHQLRFSPKLIVCHLQTNEEKALTSCLRFRSECPSEHFGVVDASSFNTKLKDVRSWTYKVNESARFTPLAAGFYLINIHPNLVVGDKIAHQVQNGNSYIVARSSDGSVFDFALSSATEFKSVWSPHCRLRVEESCLFLRPECGVATVNGKFLSDELQLKHNDRVVLGSEIMLRVAVVGTERNPKWRNVVDWVDGASECFPQHSDSSELQRLSQDVAVLEERCRRRNCGASLVLTNPPDGYSESAVWSLEDLEVGEQAVIGLHIAEHLTLKTRGVLTKDNGCYVLTAGSTSKIVHHGSRFVLGDFLFLVNDTTRKKKSQTVPMAGPSECAPSGLNISPAALVDLRNDLFDLQWSVSSLFDFAFPMESSTSLDPFAPKRRQLADDSILCSERFSLGTLATTLRMLTEAVHLVGGQLSAEIHSSDTCVNSTLLRLVHDRNRTIEQLLLGTESQAPVAWKQIEHLNASLTSKLARVTKLECELDAARLSTGMPRSELDNAAARFQTVTPTSLQLLKAQVIVPTPIVGRRLASTVESISRSGNVRHLWERYCRDLESLLDSAGGSHNVQPTKQQSVVLAILDVILAFESGVKQGWIVQGDRLFVERKMASWQLAIDQCLSSFSRSHDARRPSPLSKPSVSSRQPSPTVSRASSRDRQPTPRETSPVIRGRALVGRSPTSRLPSPNQRPVSPAVRPPSPFQRPTLSTSPAAMRAKDIQSGQLTARSSVSRVTTRSVVSATPLPQQKRTIGTASPKTLLTRQLMELELKRKF